MDNKNKNTTADTAAMANGKQGNRRQNEGSEIHALHELQAELDKESFPFFVALNMAIAGDDMEADIKALFSAAYAVEFPSNAEQAEVACLSERYFVKICILHMDIRKVAMEPVEIVLEDLQKRSLFYGEIRYESDFAGLYGDALRTWNLFADISLEDILHILHRFRFIEKDYGTVRLPVGTVVTRDGQPVRELTSELVLPIEQIEAFHLGWYGN